jgi:hypothetical protein
MRVVGEQIQCLQVRVVPQRLYTIQKVLQRGLYISYTSYCARGRHHVTRADPHLPSAPVCLELTEVLTTTPLDN